MGDAPIEPEFLRTMNAIAAALDDILNGEDSGADRKIGFVLGVFKFDELHERQGRFNYISNADRADIIVLLKEMQAKFEGQPDVVGHG